MDFTLLRKIHLTVCMIRAKHNFSLISSERIYYIYITYIVISGKRHFDKFDFVTAGGTKIEIKSNNSFTVTKFRRHIIVAEFSVFRPIML